MQQPARVEYMSVALARKELDEAMRLAAQRKEANLSWRPPDACLANFARSTRIDSIDGTSSDRLQGYCAHCCYCCFPDGRPKWQPRCTAARWLAKPETLSASSVHVKPSPMLGTLAARPWSARPHSTLHTELMMTDRKATLVEATSGPWATPMRMWPQRRMWAERPLLPWD